MYKNKTERASTVFSSDIRWERLEDVREDRTEKEQGGLHFVRTLDSERGACSC